MSDADVSLLSLIGMTFHVGGDTEHSVGMCLLPGGASTDFLVEEQVDSERARGEAIGHNPKEARRQLAEGGSRPTRCCGGRRRCR